MLNYINLNNNSIAVKTYSLVKAISVHSAKKVNVLHKIKDEE